MVAMILCNFFKKLFGNKKNKHILDGPGMVNPFTWNKFCVSRTDSYAQHNFSITVVNDYSKCILTGTLRDDDGTIYEEEDGIVIKGSDAKKIRTWDPESLPDVENKIYNDEIKDVLEGCEILDASYVSIVVQYIDGTEQKKVDADDFSLKFYKAVLPYFQKKCNNILS